jgi:hypothetical protein
MGYLIGEQLGAIVALLEDDLSKDPYDLEAMQRLALASESYRNFSMGSLPRFQQNYDKGYASASRDLRRAEQNWKQGNGVGESLSCSVAPSLDFPEI